MEAHCFCSHGDGYSFGFIIDQYFFDPFKQCCAHSHQIHINGICIHIWKMKMMKIEIIKQETI